MQLQRDFMYLDEVRDFFGFDLTSGKRLRASRGTIEKYFHQGLKKSYLGGRVIVYKSDLKNFLDMVRDNERNRTNR